MKYDFKKKHIENVRYNYPSIIDDFGLISIERIEKTINMISIFNDEELKIFGLTTFIDDLEWILEPNITLLKKSQRKKKLEKINNSKK